MIFEYLHRLECSVSFIFTPFVRVSCVSLLSASSSAFAISSQRHLSLKLFQMLSVYLCAKYKIYSTIKYIRKKRADVEKAFCRKWWQFIVSAIDMLTFGRKNLKISIAFSVDMTWIKVICIIFFSQIKWLFFWLCLEFSFCFLIMKHF